MSAGTHALELVVFIVDGGGALRESPRSPPLKVTKAGDEATRGRR